MKTRYLKNTLGVLLVTMVSVTAANAKDKGPKVGMAVQDLSNPTVGRLLSGYQKGGRFQGWKSDLCFL